MSIYFLSAILVFSFHLAKRAFASIPTQRPRTRHSDSKTSGSSSADVRSKCSIPKIPSSSKFASSMIVGSSSSEGTERETKRLGSESLKIKLMIQLDLQQLQLRLILNHLLLQLSSQSPGHALHPQLGPSERPSYFCQAPEFHCIAYE